MRQEPNKTTVFLIENRELKVLNKLPGNGSINEIIKGLGFDENLVHSVFLFDSELISVIGVKIFTKEPVFVITEVNVQKIRYEDVQYAINTIDWEFEYSSNNIEEFLLEGIENKNLTFELLSKSLSLEEKSDSVYLEKVKEIYLTFENEILVRFCFKDGLNSDSKWLKDLNISLFNSMLKEAKSFHVTEMDAIVEINNQCTSLKKIPKALNNPYISEHRTNFGNINFFNLRAAHYLPKFKLEEFLHMNFGRFIRVSQNLVKVNSYVYEFDGGDVLKSAWKE